MLHSQYFYTIFIIDLRWQSSQSIFFFGFKLLINLLNRNELNDLGLLTGF